MVGGTRDGNQYNFGIKNFINEELFLHASEAAQTSRKLEILSEDKAPIKWYFGISRAQPRTARNGRFRHEADQTVFSLMLHLKKKKNTTSSWNDSNRSSVRKTSLPWDNPSQVCAYHSVLPLRNSQVVLRNGSKSQKLGSHKKASAFIASCLFFWKLGNLWLYSIGTGGSFFRTQGEDEEPANVCYCPGCMKTSRISLLVLETGLSQSGHPPAFIATRRISQSHQYHSWKYQKMIPWIVKNSDIILNRDFRVIFPID